MFPFTRFKWAEMREVARELIQRIHAGHAAGGEFTLPVVDFLRVFAPQADAGELRKASVRGDLQFKVESEDGGSFALAEGERALFDLKREGLLIRLPATRMSGRYAILPAAFRIDFNAGEELEGCKRALILICNRVSSVEVSEQRLKTTAPNPLFDLLVEFE